MCNIPQVQLSSFLLFSALCLFELMFLFLSFFCVAFCCTGFDAVAVVGDLLLKGYESATVSNSMLAESNEG